MLDEFARRAAAGSAVVLATHDARAIDVADRVLSLRHGVLSSERERHGVATAAIDSTGRLQLPPEALELFPDGRATVEVEVDGVTHAHGDVTVLHEVSLAAGAGEFVALAVRSGSGKSTLCHLVAGVAPLQAGSILVGGRPAGEVDDWTQRSLLPQRLGLADELTVAENAFLPALLHGVPVDDSLLGRLGLEHIAGQPGVSTSLGEQQRTALARALSSSPRLVVLDEPTGHQDDDNVERVLAVLTAAAEAGRRCSRPPTTRGCSTPRRAWCGSRAAG